jgi:Tfp pilus assembly protein PilO
MNRTALVLSVLGAVIVIVLFSIFVFQPAREELAEVEDQIALEQTEQGRLEGEIERLRLVREQAPTVEAELAAADAIVPTDPALPALVRQLQLAADEAGITLASVTTSRPVALEGAPTEGLSSIEVSTQLEGGYFQIVDFLRRIEDPAISPRGIEWVNTTVTRDDEGYPDLSVTLAGRAYAVLEVPVPPEPEPDPEAESAEGEDDAEGEDADTGDEADGDDEAEDAS